MSIWLIVFVWYISIGVAVNYAVMYHNHKGGAPWNLWIALFVALLLSPFWPLAIPDLIKDK